MSGSRHWFVFDESKDAKVPPPKDDGLGQARLSTR